jgi:hypothetical protein
MTRRSPGLTDAGVNPNEKLTVSELCAELKVSRSFFYRLAPEAPRATLHPPAKWRAAHPSP